MKYSKLTSGYLGQVCPGATLNSAFWAQFEYTDQNLIKHLHLPQRVPRPDFFKELFELEARSVHKKFKSRVSPILARHKKLSKLSSLSQSEAMLLLNLERILIRLGQYQIFKSQRQPKIQDPNISVKLQLVRESARIYLCYTKNLPVPVKNLNAIWNKSKGLAPDTQIEASIRFIVYTSRYSKLSDIKECTVYLQKAVNIFKPQTSQQWALLAMAYRALPMSKSVDLKQSSNYLAKMLKILNNFQPANTTEKILWDELKLTSLQSMSKWERARGNLEKSQAYIEEMLALDPNDSTVYSELGLLLFDLNKFSEAKRRFKKAVELGPPATSMNSYFLGLCEVELGQKLKAIKHFELSREYDATALSPLISLLELYPSKKARLLSRFILSQRHLTRQLEPIEQLQLRARLR